MTEKNKPTGETAGERSTDSNGNSMDKSNAFPIEIPDGTDLNDAGDFAAAVFDDLPPVLRDACERLADRTEREVFLVGALGVISGLLPNVRGFYDQQFYGANLFVYILAPYGSGKGTLKLARALGEAIHAQKKDISAQLYAEYRSKLKEYQQDKSATDEPTHPGSKMAFMPANNSKSGLLQLIHENDERGILFETEGDTLADALRQEQGNFSDLLRKAFHHEAVSFYRRTEREFREIENPYLSVVLSSTPDQYLKLIPTVQNGLFSRFLHFSLKPAKEFRNVFDREKRGYPEYFAALGEDFLKVFLHLEGLENDPIEFEFRPEQEARFLSLFGGWKQDFGEYVSPDMEGTANRLGLICFRLAMILTALRNLWEGDYTPRMICNDADFYNALRITEVFKRHALRVFYQLPKPAISKEATEYEKELTNKADKVAQVRLLSAQGKNPRQIEAITGIPKSTAERWINQS